MDYGEMVYNKTSESFGHLSFVTSPPIFFLIKMGLLVWGNIIYDARIVNQKFCKASEVYSCVNSPGLRKNTIIRVDVNFGMENNCNYFILIF